MQQDFPAVSSAMGGAEPVAEAGGLRDAPAITPLSRAKASVDQAAAEARRLSPEERRELLDHMRQVSEQVAGALPWEDGEDGPGF